MVLTHGVTGSVRIRVRVTVSINIIMFVLHIIDLYSVDGTTVYLQIHR